MLRIKNISGSNLDLHLKSFIPDEFLDLPSRSAVDEWNCDFIYNEINNSINFFYGDDLLSKNTAIAYLKNKYPISVAVDKENFNQEITGTEWTTITGSRKLWDYSNNYNLVNNSFTPHIDGIFFCDGQFKLEMISGCTSIELAVFQGDDYWFILDKKNISTDEDIQLSAATLFDMRDGESFDIKVKLSGPSPYAVICGCDDYTAWGWNFERPLYGE